MPLLTVQTLLIYFPGAQSEWSTVAIYNKATSGKLNVNLNKVDCSVGNISIHITGYRKRISDFPAKEIITVSIPRLYIAPSAWFLECEKGRGCQTGYSLPQPHQKDQINKLIWKEVFFHSKFISLCDIGFLHHSIRLKYSWNFAPRKP